MKSALLEMKERHEQEEEMLRTTCQHAKEFIKIKLDRSVIGAGSIYPAVEVICRNCGTEKVIFHLNPTERKKVKKTLKSQKFKHLKNDDPVDQRLDCYTHYDSDLE